MAEGVSLPTMRAQWLLDELQRETRSKNKATAVKLAIREYLRRKKIEKIKSMKGKLEFDLTADEIRHYER